MSVREIRKSSSAVQVFEISNRTKYYSYFSIRFETTYRHQFLTYLTELRRFFTLSTTPINQQNQQYGVLQLLQQKPQ